MRGKRWVTWLLAGLLALGSFPAGASVPVKTTAVQAMPAAANVLVLTREAARKEVLALPVVQIASRKAQEAYDEWQNAIGRANDLDTEKRTFKSPWTGKMETILYNDVTQLRLRMQKYLLPDQMKFAWQMASKSTDMTINSMENAMDSLLLGLFSAQHDVKTKSRSRILASQALLRAKASKAAGNVTQLDVDAAALDLEKADKALLAAQRSLENQSRNYNRFAGAPLSRALSVSLAANGSIPLLTADEYVAQALQNRMTLFSLRESILLKERNVEMLTFHDMHKPDPDIASEYARAVLDLEKMRVDLTANERTVTAEIRSAAIAVESAQLDMKSAQLSLQRQKLTWEKTKKLIAAGRIPAWSDDAMVSAITGTEEGLSAVQLSIDAKVRKFRQAVQGGPAYSGY